MKALSSIEPVSTATRVANAMRVQILKEEPGEYLGSEASLADTLGVSLPTLRQAARMLEHEQILQIRPGKGGGYFCRQPDVETVTNSAALFLRNHDTPNKMINDAIDSMMGPIMSAAVKCKDKGLRARLEMLSSSSLMATREVDETQFRLEASELVIIFAEMSGNLFFEMFYRILFNEIYLSNLSKEYIVDEVHLLRDREIRVQWADAVLAGDKSEAMKLAKKRSKLYRSWPQKPKSGL